VNPEQSPQPQVAVLGGINGAGKTTASHRILREALRIPLFTNADTLARGLNAFDPESEAVKAGRIMLEHLRELAAARRSFAFETTLAARTYARWLEELRREGYAVHLFYFWLDCPELAIQRVADRVRAGGHHVSEETIRRRYSRSVRNFLELYRPIATTWQVYDNSSGGSRLIAFNNSFFDTIVDDACWELVQRSHADGSEDPSSGSTDRS
jgi:predicted ABC-type ATPase